MQVEEIKIDSLVLGMVQTNCYFVTNKTTKEVIIIDPADEVEEIRNFIESNSLKVVGILLTHGHFDHIMVAESISSSYHAKIYAGSGEKELLSDARLNCSASICRPVTLVADVNLEDNEKITLAGMEIQAIHTPGHTRGGVCYYFKEHGLLFSGDTLFWKDVGRSDLPTGNGETLMLSIQEKLMVLDEEIKVYPGHGMDTTIGFEKKNNFYLVN